MKLLRAAIYVLLASQVTTATPILDGVTDLAEYSSVNPQHEAVAALNRHELEKRITCQTINHVIRTIVTSKSTLAFISLSTVMTRVVCSYAHGSDCGDLTLIIQTGFNMILLAAASYSGAEPEILPGARKRDGHGIHAEYVDWWEKLLSDSASGLTYDAISHLPFDDEEEMLQRRDGDPALVSRVLVSGVTGNHSPNTKQDVVINHFADGNALLHLPVGESSSDELGKRTPPGSGFKISYTTRAKSKLSYSQQQEMSGFIAAAWATASKTYDMTDFIGFVETGHLANFYYRVIPEIRGFGLNYESVDVCGQMGGFL
ncbi:hypothetical protein J3E68DRAFT_429572 [Trichoderma sp. SZMC 28012]